MLDAVSNDKKIVIEWGFFGLIEFLISESRNIQKKYKSALDIGSSHGNHTKIMRHFGLSVDQIDKYEIMQKLIMISIHIILKKNMMLFFVLTL